MSRSALAEPVAPEQQDRPAEVAGYPSGGSGPGRRRKTGYLAAAGAAALAISAAAGSVLALGGGPHPARPAPARPASRVASHRPAVRAAGQPVTSPRASAPPGAGQLPLFSLNPPAAPAPAAARAPAVAAHGQPPFPARSARPSTRAPTDPSRPDARAVPAPD
jgi:hypothetical protein